MLLFSGCVGVGVSSFTVICTVLDIGFFIKSLPVISPDKVIVYVPLLLAEKFALITVFEVSPSEASVLSVVPDKFPPLDESLNVHASVDDIDADILVVSPTLISFFPTLIFQLAIFARIYTN